MTITNKIRELMFGNMIDEINQMKLLQGKVLCRELYLKNSVNIQDYEFKIFSQFGDDGIIQYLINKVNISKEEEIFVEFGVENYKESNTRFLLINNNWKGLVMDGSVDNIKFIMNDEIYWKHDITAVNKFITKGNINQVLVENRFTGKIGLLHIDMDGNDYWVWKNIKVIDPIILIFEYNSVFGSGPSVTIPYTSLFDRNKAHYSNLYWGASLGAYYDLALERGYVFIGTNSAGNNAYFVKKDRSKSLRKLSLQEGYTESKYRESRDEKGNLTYISGSDRIKVIAYLPVYDLCKRKLIKISKLLK